jgi:polyvinyl alcohol dehydrogenase (cytochrome)
MGTGALIAGQKSGVAHAIDPDREGAVLWQTRVCHGGKLGGVQWGSAVAGERVYVAPSDVLVRPGLGTTRFRLGPDQGGGLFALDIATGKIVWQMPHPGCGETPGCSRAQSAAVTAIPGVVVSGGVDGHLRAYDAATGTIAWDVDTKRDYAPASRSFSALSTIWSAVPIRLMRAVGCVSIPCWRQWPPSRARHSGPGL